MTAKHCTNGRALPAGEISRRACISQAYPPKEPTGKLLVAKAFHGIQLRGAAGGHRPEDDAYDG